MHSPSFEVLINIIKNDAKFSLLAVNLEDGYHLLMTVA
jgi:hypothetical protein